MMASKSEIAEDRAAAILAPMYLSEDAEREACIVLAGAAITVAGGDPEAAKGPLTEVLTAIGAISYESAGIQTFWGTRPRHKQERDEEEDT